LRDVKSFTTFGSNFVTTNLFLKLLHFVLLVEQLRLDVSELFADRLGLVFGVAPLPLPHIALLFVGLLKLADPPLGQVRRSVSLVLKPISINS
jgi:hypothetical protein